MSDRALRGLAWAALLATGVLLRLPGVDPPSFWNDDEWPAIAVREMSWGEFAALRPPLPAGFRGLQQLAGGLSDDPEWPLQVVPLAASVLQALLAGLLAGRLGRDRDVAFVAAAWALVTPIWTEYGVRPKQYPTDAVATLAVLWLALRAWQEPGAARVAAWLAGCVAALAVSFPAAFAVASTAAVTALVPGARAPFARPPLRAALALAVAAAAALVVFAQRQSGEAIHAAWSAKGGFLLGDSPRAGWSALARFAWSAATEGFPPGLSWLALAAGAGAFALARRRGPDGRAALLAIAGIFAGRIAASALGLYPLGTGRLAAFHVPLGPVLLAVGIGEALRRWTRPGRRRALLVATAALAALPFAERSSYRASDDAAAARAVWDRLRPGDTVVTFLRSAHSLGSYTPGPHEIVAEPRLGCRFYARLAHPDTAYLTLGRTHAMLSPEAIDAQLDPVLAAAGPRIVFVPPRFGNREIREREAHVLSRIAAAGYRDVDSDADPRFVRVLRRGG